MIKRESIKKQISQAIKQLPSIATIYRENINKYNERVDFNKIAELEGLFYGTEKYIKKEIHTEEDVHYFTVINKNFLTVYDELSMRVKQGDILKVEDRFFKINDVGENMQIYCLMFLTEYENLQSIDEYILEDNIVHEITEYDNEPEIKFR